MCGDVKDGLAFPSYSDLKVKEGVWNLVINQNFPSYDFNVGWQQSEAELCGFCCAPISWPTAFLSG